MVETTIYRKILVYLGFFFSNLLAGASFVLLWIWEVILVGFTLVSGVLGIALLLNLQLQPVIPPMPYWCAVLFGLSFLALSPALAVGSIYFGCYLHQLMRSFARYNHNTLARAKGRAVLPSISGHPQFSPEKRRRLRNIALFSLAAFAIFFILAMIVSIFSAQSLEFWHKWQWFN